MRRMTALLASLALLLTLFQAATLAAPSGTETWIVTLRDDVPSAAAAHGLARQHGGEVGHVYTHALNGFSFRGSQTAAAALMRNPNVLLVEADAEVRLETTQSNATWGLDRIDQRSLPLSGTYTYDATGSGVTAYVIDSGIRRTHNDFGNRVVDGFDAIDGSLPADDCNGHGTHVAGTIGGSTWGVAKNVTLVAVRVFDCSGGSAWSTIIAGIDWVTANAVKPAVANMSLGGSSNSSVDTATNNMIQSGIATAVAAGNGNFIGRQADACNYSPARVPAAMTVSATNSSDQKASWANYGNCVDWFAPGVSITSAWYTSNSATSTISGTSMASPHTAGVAALYLQANPNASPQAVRDALFAQTTKDIVTSSSTANNDLLYMGFLNDGGTTPPPPDENDAPVAHNVTASGNENTSISWSPSVSDPDGDALICSIAAQSSSAGTATVATDCSSGTYTPPTDFTGVATFTYAVTDGELSDTGTVTVTVIDVSSGGITLSVTGYKVQGVKRADLAWSGATSANVDVYRNNTLIVTTPNDGFHTDNTGQRGGGSNTYRICEAGTSTCSNSVTISY